MVQTATETLIEPVSLLSGLEGRQPLLIDARTPEAHAAGHLPGAVHLSTYGCFAADTTPRGLAAFVDEVAGRLASVGVSMDRPVVVYEDGTGMRAARELWILQYLGHPRAYMLHGGLNQWRDAGGAVSAGPVAPRAASFVPIIQPSVLATADEIARGLASTDAGAIPRTLIDVRDASEFAGTDDTPCCARRGHLPGAVWIEWTQFLDGDRLLAPAAVHALLRSHGIDGQGELIPYCHRGARSASAFHAMRLAGLPQVRNFIGSWHEWSARPTLPIEHG